MRVLIRRLLCVGLLLSAPGTALAQDTSTGCPVHPLPIDIARLRAAPGVDSVVPDASGTRVTVMFANGDVLRVGATGCLTSMLAVRLWPAGDEPRSDAMWLQRARSVAGLVLAPAQSAQVNASLESGAAITHVDGGLTLERPLANGAGYSLTVVRTPRDGLGPSLSMVFRNL